MNRRDDLQATGPAGGGFDSARLRGSLGRNDGGNRRSRRKCRDGGRRWRDGDRRSRRWNGWRVVRGRRLEWRNEHGRRRNDRRRGRGGRADRRGRRGHGRWSLGRCRHDGPAVAGGAGGAGAGGRGGTTGTAGTGGNASERAARRHGRRRWTGRFQRRGRRRRTGRHPGAGGAAGAVRRAAPAAARRSCPPGITQTITVAKDGSGQFTTVGAAVNSIASGSSAHIRIDIKAGHVHGEADHRQPHQPVPGRCRRDDDDPQLRRQQRDGGQHQRQLQRADQRQRFFRREPHDPEQLRIGVTGGRAAHDGPAPAIPELPLRRLSGHAVHAQRLAVLPELLRARQHGLRVRRRDGGARELRGAQRRGRQRDRARRTPTSARRTASSTWAASSRPPRA